MIARNKIVVVVLVLALLAVYVQQRFDYAHFFLGVSKAGAPNASFVINRLVRLIINDGLCLLLIKYLFDNERFSRLGFYLFLSEVLLLLPIYLLIKLSWEGPSEVSSPLLSQIHRMIVNPLLMIILIAGFYYQQFTEKRS